MQQNNEQFSGSGERALSWLQNRGISPEVVRLFNLSWYQHPLHGPCIRIPVNGQWAKYRRDPLDERKPKYWYDTGSRVSLYGLSEFLSVPERKTVVITEGELDTLVLWSLNIPAITSTGGALSFQEEWKSTLEGKDVYVCFDNDDAGAEGMARILEFLPDAKVIFIPEQPNVKDISDFVARGGDFHALMQTARSYASTTDVEEERVARLAQWLPVRFHDKYLDKRRTRELRRLSPKFIDKTDDVAVAKLVPMDSLMEFTRRKAVCPWHNERTPSLHYYPKTNSAYCFGSCGRAYDVIDLYRLQHSCSFRDAVDALKKMV